MLTYAQSAVFIIVVMCIAIMVVYVQAYRNKRRTATAQLIEILPGAIILIQDDQVTYANPAALQLMVERDSKTIEGLPLTEFIHPDSVDKWDLHTRRLNEGGRQAEPLEMKLRRRDGTVTEIEVMTTPAPHLGRSAVMLLAQDISDQKKAEEEQRGIESKLRKSEDQYYLLQMSLDRFSSDLFGVIQMEELNRRLVKEVSRVIETEKVSLVKIDREGKATVIHGSQEIPTYVTDTIKEWGAGQLPQCQLIDTLDGHFVKIGEEGGGSSILCLAQSASLMTYEAKRIWLETISRYVSVLYDNFRVIEDLRRNVDQLASQQTTPLWVLRLMFHLSENERKRLSQDLHDAALQEQIVWYRKLDQLAVAPEVDPQIRSQLVEIGQGLLDVIHQIRITCNELRPPLLKEEGLERSLEALFEFTQMRTDYAIHFEYSELGPVLSDDVLVGLYRIIQELLSNATKHSQASRVIIKLFCQQEEDQLCLHYEDNGIGMNMEETVHKFSIMKGMGLHGIQERVRSMNGDIEFESMADAGLSVRISIPNRISGRY